VDGPTHGQDALPTGVSEAEDGQEESEEAMKYPPNSDDDLFKRTDAVGTTGGKATVETYLVPPKPKNSIEKIKLKHAPKQYKLGAGPTGQARLQRSVNSLMLKALRLSLKSKDADEAAWAERLATILKDFNMSKGK
jgi:hypothetical protein